MTTKPLIPFIENLFFAYRSFTSEPDDLLKAMGLGRAHHRALYFIYQNPKIKVGALLELLQIKKQSLARVLKQLIEKKLVLQHKGKDQRQRHLSVSSKGRELIEKLIEIQSYNIKKALSTIETHKHQDILNFLNALHKRAPQ